MYAYGFFFLVLDEMKLNQLHKASHFSTWNLRFETPLIPGQHLIQDVSQLHSPFMEPFPQGQKGKLIFSKTHKQIFMKISY